MRKPQQIAKFADRVSSKYNLSGNLHSDKIILMQNELDILREVSNLLDSAGIAYAYRIRSNELLCPTSDDQRY